MEERSLDRLARYLIWLGFAAIVTFVCWYFRSVLIYVIAAFVVSLIGRPIIMGLRRIRIKGRSAPDWLLTILTLVIIFAVLGLIVTQAVPVVTGIIRDASLLNASGAGDGMVLDKLNQWLIGIFPVLGEDFNGVKLLMDQLRDVLNFSSVSSVFNTLREV